MTVVDEELAIFNFRTLRRNFEQRVATTTEGWQDPLFFVTGGHQGDNKKHKTLRVTPVMEAGIADHVWILEKTVRIADQ